MDKDNKAVSAVIAVILMVAITVVLAGVLYVWVMGMANTGEASNLIIGANNDGYDFGYLIITITSTNGNAAIEDMTLMIKRDGQVTYKQDLGNLTDRYFPANDYTVFNDTANNTIVYDNDNNGYLGKGDTIKLRAELVMSGDVLEAVVGNQHCRIMQI